MSASSARRLVTAGSLSLALTLAAPAAAFAAPSDGRGDDGKGGGKPSPRATSTATPAPAPAQQSGSSTGRSGGAQGQSSSRSEGKPAKKTRQAPAQRATTSDPRGNNGTVKVDGLPFDDTAAHEPHVGCLFQIDFFGFDKGDVADITLTGQAPTGGGLLWSSPNTPISDDAAGGGQDVDAAITVSVAQLDLAGATAHPQQGYHVKLAADVESAPGGAKQKVFWIMCDQAPAVAGTSTAAASGGGTFSARAVDRAPLAPTFGEGSTAVASGGVAGSAAAGSTAGASAGEATVSARSAARPSVLPFTGAEGLGYLLALGLSAVGVGTLAHRLGRRRASA